MAEVKKAKTAKEPKLADPIEASYEVSNNILLLSGPLTPVVLEGMPRLSYVQQ